jgi:heme o synthase
VIEATGTEFAGGRAPSRALSLTVGSAASVFKPGIAAGVSLAALAGMAQAGRGLPSPKDAALCMAVIMLAAMGAGAANSVLDAGIDSSMSRVGRRVEALRGMGRLPVLTASAGFVCLSLWVAYTCFGALTAALILVAVFSYTVLYTLYFKRRSPYGTVPGGLPGALPVLIGYSAVTPYIGADGLILFTIMLLWQPPHFLALALRYRDDYRRAAVPVMPVVLGEGYTRLFMFMYMTALPPAGAALWLFGGASGYFAAYACATGLLYLAVSYMDVFVTQRYGRAFAASIVYIMALLVGVVVDSGLT